VGAVGLATHPPRSPKLIDDYIEKMERYAVPFFKRFSGIAEIREVHLEEWVDYS